MEPTVLVENVEYRCASCGFTAPADDFPPVEDALDRIKPGDVFTDVQCPSCGSLAFPATPTEAFLAWLSSCPESALVAGPGAPGAKNAIVNVAVDKASVDKAVAAIQEAWMGIEQSAVRFVLDGVGVPDLRELHRLVELGRKADPPFET